MSVLTTQNVQARVPFGTKYYFSSNLEKAFSTVEVVEDSRLFLTYPALKEWYRCNTYAIRTDERACLFHSADAAGAGPQLQQLCNPPRG